MSSEKAARDRDRTGTSFTSQDFKSCASANSATRAQSAIADDSFIIPKEKKIVNPFFIFFSFYGQTVSKQQYIVLILFALCASFACHARIPFCMYYLKLQTDIVTIENDSIIYGYVPLHLSILHLQQHFP